MLLTHGLGHHSRHSILPFDVLSIVIGEAMAQLKVVRLLRLMRLIKLIRLVRASRMFKRWETHMAIDYGASDAPVSTSTHLHPPRFD